MNGTASKGNHDLNLRSNKDSAAIKCVRIPAQGAVASPKKEQLVVRSPVIKCVTILNHVVARSNKHGAALKGNHNLDSKSNKE